ncbi:probable serine/threonine-protein kinase kinX [Dysidea avara]|uniref:probable serine/threonine-protein kinase kinX n=1 Tax=Dysidea avara TaxID=196820 RepID=UPI00331EEC9F
MDGGSSSIHLRSLYLTGVSQNGNDIGVGAYGKVFEVNYCGSTYAAKQVHPILVQGVSREEIEATKRAFLFECVQSSALSHPNVVQFLGVYNPGGQSPLPALVMERMQENLSSLVKKYSDIPLYVKLSVLLDVSKGLCDLGVAKVIQADSRKMKTRAPGTVDFMPPEALLENPEYGSPLDVFSYGGMILHVVNQEWPKPLHFVAIDAQTKMPIGLTEVERR